MNEQHVKHAVLLTKSFFHTLQCAQRMPRTSVSMRSFNGSSAEETTTDVPGGHDATTGSRSTLQAVESISKRGVLNCVPPRSSIENGRATTGKRNLMNEMSMCEKALTMYLVNPDYLLCNAKLVLEKLSCVADSYLKAIRFDLCWSLTVAKIDVRAWHTCFYRMVQVFRKLPVNENTRADLNRALDTICHFYSVLLMLVSSTKNADTYANAVCRWMVNMGDICRYRIQFNGVNATCSLPADAQEHESEYTFANMAESFYKHAAALGCQSAKPYHRLAVLAIARRRPILVTIEYIYKAIGLLRTRNTESDENLFQNLENMLYAVFERNKANAMSTADGTNTKAAFLTTLILCHENLYTGVDLDMVKTRAKQLRAMVSKLDDESILGQAVSVTCPDHFSERSRRFADYLITQLQTADEEHETDDELPVTNDTLTQSDHESDEEQSESYEEEISAEDMKDINPETLKLILYRNELRRQLRAKRKEKKLTPTPLESRVTRCAEVNLALRLKLVLDTNCLMSNLDILQSLYERCDLLIPKVVLTELREIAKRNVSEFVQEKARKALKWLDARNYREMTDYSNKQSNDDRILQCCRRLVENGERHGDTVLVTGDLNLALRAHATGVPCMPARVILRKLNGHRIVT